jgi:hypothetical protein
MYRPLVLPTKLLFSGQLRLAEKGAFEQMARELRNKWLTLFSNSEASEVGGSGHYIQKEAPDAVVSAIQVLLPLAQAPRSAANNAINADVLMTAAHHELFLHAGYGER